MYKLWLVLLVIAGGIALWFSGIALYNGFGYWKLGPTAPAEITAWQVKEISASKFGMEATYVYEVEGKQYSGKTLFKTPIYLNPYSAEDDIVEWKELSWRVWYKKSNPAISSLQKYFPTKEILQAILTIGVFVYFYFMRQWVLRDPEAIN